MAEEYQKARKLGQREVAQRLRQHLPPYLPALDETVDGQVMSTYDLDPGEYMLTFTSKDNPTGTLIAMSYSIQEMQEQNDKLEEALAEALGQ